MMDTQTVSQPSPPNSPIAQLAPGEIKIWPDLLTAARKTKQHGAVRAWFAARHKDSCGRGRIEKQQVVDFLLKNGASLRTIRRWMAMAKEMKLFRVLQEADETEILLLSSLEKTAQILHLTRIGSRPVAVPADRLFVDGWINTVWAGVLAVSNGRPISRRTMQENSHTSRHTQLLREEKINVTKIFNYVVSDAQPDRLRGIQELYHQHAFILTRKGAWRSSGRSQTVAWQHSNSYSVDVSEARTLRKGRTLKVNKKLQSSPSSSSNLGRGSGDGEGYRETRRIFATEKMALSKAKHIDPTIQEVYTPRKPEEILSNPALARSGFYKSIRIRRVEP
jgi:hypothetical protein